MALSRLKPGFESRWGQHRARASRKFAALALVVFCGCPTPAERSLNDGHRAAQQGDWPTAKSRYAKASGLEPQNAKAHALTGYAAEQSGTPTEATEAYERAIRLDARNATARVGLASVALENRDAGAALTWLDGLDSESAAITKCRALLLRAAPGDAEAALALASSFSAKSASNELSYLEGSAELALGNFAIAQERFEALERAERSSPLGPYGLARLAAAQKRSTDVLLYLKAARTASKQRWNSQAVAADPAFAFLAAERAFTDVVGP